MKTLTVRIPDDVYDRVKRRAEECGASLDQQVVELLDRCIGAGDELALSAARTRMQELFRTVRGFRMAPRIPREELYERGRVH